MARMDPVTDTPINIGYVGKNAVMVESKGNKWLALKVFEDVDDAVEWRNSFDLFTAVALTEEDKDPKSGKVRLVGKDWATNFMEPADLELWKADVESAKPKPDAESAKPKPEVTPAPKPEVKPVPKPEVKAAPKAAPKANAKTSDAE